MALSACAGARPRPRFVRASRRPRYVVATQSFYWGVQDLTPLAPARALRLPDFAGARGHTVLTVVNDDGTNVQRLILPGLYHCASTDPASDLLYVIGNHRPGALIALNAGDLTLARLSPKPDDTDVRNFAGHGVGVNGAMAFTMNNFERGKFDEISLRDPFTLREIDRFSTHGFQAHEIRLTEDGKYFVCGHYGSYLGQGPYQGLGIYGDAPDKYVHQDIVYPASVSLVEVRSGKRFRVVSGIQAGQEGHATTDSENRVYLPNDPALLDSRPDVATNDRFREGERDVADGAEFASTAKSFGIALVYDPAYRELIVPVRARALLLITSTVTQEPKLVDFAGSLRESGLHWAKPGIDWISGIAFHPDGKHYVVSTSDGFLAFERGTHRLNPAKSFALPLLVHSHVCVL
jgi:hypothetical protein